MGACRGSASCDNRFWVSATGASAPEGFPEPLPKPEPEPLPKPEHRSFSSPCGSDWIPLDSKNFRSWSAGGSGPIASFFPCRLLPGRRPGRSIPTQNPHTFPVAASVHRNKSFTRSNSARICSTASGVTSGRLYEYTVDQTRRGTASNVQFASASGIRLANSARQLGGCTRASLSERHTPSPSTTRFGITVCPPFRDRVGFVPRLHAQIRQRCVQPSPFQASGLGLSLQFHLG